MKVLVRFFWELCLLRRGPQDMPGNTWLLQVLLILNLLIDSLLGLPAFQQPLRAIGVAAFELVLSAGLLFAALQVRGYAARWLQTYIALLGSGMVLGLFGLVYRLLAVLLGLQGLVGGFDLGLFFWNILVLAHILRHALEITLPFAVLVVIAYTMFLIGLVAQWLPPEVVNQAPEVF